MIHPVNIAGMKPWVAQLSFQVWDEVGALPELTSWNGDLDPDPTYSYDNGVHTLTAGENSRYGSSVIGIAFGMIPIQTFTLTARVTSRPLQSFGSFGIFFQNPVPTDYSGVGIRIGHRGLATPSLMSHLKIRDYNNWLSRSLTLDDPATLDDISYIKLTFDVDTQEYTTEYSSDNINWNIHESGTIYDGDQNWNIGGYFIVGIYGALNNLTGTIDQLTLIK
jgi:hypothetical protein